MERRKRIKKGMKTQIRPISRSPSMDHLNRSNGRKIEYIYDEKIMTKYRWGNPKKLKKLTKKFSTVSTMHGFRYMFGSKTTCFITWIWRLFFAFCIGIVIFTVVSLIRKLTGEDSLVIKTSSKLIEQGPKQNDFFPVFPLLTFCRLPPWNIENTKTPIDLLKYGFLALGYPFASFSPNQMAGFVDHIVDKKPPNLRFLTELAVIKLRYNIISRATPNFKDEYFIANNSFRCSEIFQDCIWYMTRFDCCKFFAPVLTSHSLCYQFTGVPDVQLINEVERGGLPFYLALKTPVHEEMAQPVGFYLSATHPNETVSFFDPINSKLMIPNYDNSVSISLKVTKRESLYTPWHGFYTDCPTLPESLEPEPRLRQRYNQRTCSLRHYSNVIAQICQCSLILYPTRDPNGEFYPNCSAIQIESCYMKHMLLGEKDDELSYARTLCRSPCTQYDFHMDTTTTILSTDDYTRVSIRYNMIEYDLSEYNAMSILQILSQIGGSLGLYLGASIITIVEILNFCVHAIWYRCIPSRKPVSVSTSFPK